MRGTDPAVANLITKLGANLFFIAFLAVSFPVLAAPASAEPPPAAAQAAPPPHAYGAFPLDPCMGGRVRFWVDVYAKYHSWEMAIHDVRLPQLVFSSVDTREKGPGAAAAEKQKVAALLKRLASRWDEIRSGRLQRETLKPEERRLLEVFEREQLLEEIPKVAADPKRLRGQAGLRDALEDALFVSGRYLPRMERVFERFSLPTEIAYLPFVESGFNKRAVSKVGASGIWQFMPYTGKLYLRVDEVVDERNDPMRAAEAAARLMKTNFETLGEWPLAITAYNHGTLGMARAAKEVGSKKICDIIAGYEQKTFGFASQNFYASFLAALHVAKNSQVFLGMVPRARQIEFDEFVMPDYMDIKVFLERLGIDETLFRELNPALTEEVYSGRRYIPVGYTVRVPVEARADFLVKYDAIPAASKFKEQKKSEAETASLPKTAPSLFSDRKTGSSAAP